MSKTSQNNFKPQRFSTAAIVERIKDGTYEPQQKIKVGDVSPEAKSIVNLIDQFEKINAKNNCMRVRFYDWFADYLERTAQKMRDRAFNITSPCAISLPPPKEKKPEAEVIIKSGLSFKYPYGMKLTDDEVKAMTPITNLSPDIQESINSVAKKEEEYAKTLADKEKK